MEYIKASELQFDPRPQMSDMFTEGFYVWLKYFSKDKNKLKAAFAHIFKPECFYLAVDNGEIAAMAACVANSTKPVAFDKKTLIKNLGIFRGRFAHYMLTKQLINSTYPIEMTSQSKAIEFVVTSPKHQGKRLGQNLLTFIMNAKVPAEYVLEVADNNAPAVHLYKKLGFVEVKRVAAHKKSGFDYLLYMAVQNSDMAVKKYD